MIRTSADLAANSAVQPSPPRPRANQPGRERVLGGVAPHLMVTDPPYGVNYDPAWRNQAGRSSLTTLPTALAPIGVMTVPVAIRRVVPLIDVRRDRAVAAEQTMPPECNYRHGLRTIEAIAARRQAAEIRSKLRWLLGALA
jgi:hypothetical protein